VILDNVKRYSVGDKDMVVCMEYKSECSKNDYKTRDGYIRRDVKKWMEQLSWVLRMLMLRHRTKFDKSIRVEINCCVDGTGRLPDTQNFIDVISDAVEHGLSVNDQQYKIVALPSMRAKYSEISIEVKAG
jgi:hypothetical protein